MQPDLFDGEIAPLSIPRRRPVGDYADCYQPEYHQVEPGVWVVVHYARSPKTGWPENWEFPMFWGEGGAWSAPHVDGEIAPNTYAWRTRADARADVEDNYPPGRPILAGVSRFPSMDQRRKNG